MTIKELAQLAGVSTATVSRALNGGAGVNPETQRKILKLAKELDYQPNILAKGLSSQKTYTIGVLVADITNPFYAEVMRGIEDIAIPYNYTPVFFNTDYDVEKERRALAFLRNGRIDGLIASVSNRVVDECASLANSDCALVMLGHMMEEVKCQKVGCNNYSSAYTITEYLIKAGHRNIVHVAGHKETKTGIQRLQGFRAALDNYDIPVNPGWVLTTDYFSVSAYQKMRELLKKDRSVTAVFAANDYMAAGCYRAIYEAGLRIPQDISVVGHDDIETATTLYPGLTTMHQQTRKIGRIAARSLFSTMEKGKTVEDIIVVPTSLVERDSVKTLASG